MYAAYNNAGPEDRRGLTWDNRPVPSWGDLCHLAENGNTASQAVIDKWRAVALFVSGAGSQRPRPDICNGTGTYGDALEALWSLLRVGRKGWNGKGMWLELQLPDANSKMTLPYIYIRTAQGDTVPWLCSQTDALASDWEIVP
jgi:hypothetical protein